jgi:hypothetical protein
MIEVVVVVASTLITIGSAPRSYSNLLACDRGAVGFPIQLCLLTSTVILAKSFSLYQLQRTVKGAILMHADRFGSLAVAKGPAVVKSLCNCPIAQRLFKIMESTKKLIDKKSAHLDSLIYIQKRVYNCGKSMVVENEKSGVKLRGMQDSSVVC